MPYDPRRHHRHSIRLKGYDYSLSGAYFVTICVHYGQCALGEVQDGELLLSPYGQIVTAAWDDLPNHYAHIELDAFVVMPNHIHGIIVLLDTNTTVRTGLRPAPADIPPDVEAGLRPTPTGEEWRHNLSEIVRAFKSFSARRINQSKGVQRQPFWQRNYYEHIIRNERAYLAIREYIIGNPANWEADKLNPHMPANQFNRYWR